jgi:hypothetical protein
MSACDLGLTGVNDNPNNPETVPVETVLASGIWNLVANSAGRGVLGEWTTLYHTTVWSQHLAQPAYNGEDNYVPRPGINRAIWSEMYSGALMDFHDVGQTAEANDDQNLVAVAEILQVSGFLFLSDLFGDVPYFEAFDLEQFQNPHFTPQSEIYPDLLKRLAAAVEMIDVSEEPAWAGGDLLYGGDLDAWRKFANSLRLRIAIRISGTSAASLAEDAFVAAWSDGPFASNDDKAAVRWTGRIPSQNPLYEALVLADREGDFRVSKTLVDILTQRADPRLPIYAAPSVTGGLFRGLPNGVLPADLGLGANDFSTLGTKFIAADEPSVLMSYAEVLLLGAEAAELGWIPDDPEALYEAGITASMLDNGVAQAAINTYLAAPANAYSDVEDTQLQKWIALFLNGPESFAEVRRTGVPELPLPFEAVLDQLPTRMPYPEQEGLVNPNAKNYVGTELDVPMWWMPLVPPVGPVGP